MDVFVDAYLAGIDSKWNENILVALGLGGHCWTHKKIQIFCDNLAVVNVLK